MKKQTHTELNFCLKLIRNSLILTGILFLSMWIGNDINWAMNKSIIIFFVGYILTELANRYRLKQTKDLKVTPTLIL